MRTQAEVAIENKISLEVKKDGLTQRQNGDWVLRFTAQNIDMDQVIVNAPMGTRFFMTLNELNDDETPTDHKAIARDKWRDLGPTKQAGMRCADPVFWAWLEEEGYPRGKRHPCSSNDDAAELVRGFCSVASRADLAKPGFSEHRIKWYEIDNAFQAWRAKENA
jgi:hypothetical protein